MCVIHMFHFSWDYTRIYFVFMHFALLIAKLYEVDGDGWFYLATAIFSILTSKNV